jgi:uncharacterized protein YhaN
MERLRREGENRVLARASEFAARLTQGSLSGLTVSLDEADKPRLVATRADDRQLTLEEMSDGTRDAVFLALRLGSLDVLSEERSLPPLVLDDALIHLDDGRAGAALSALSALSPRIQVLFFTHHARLRDLAEATLPRDRVKIHALRTRFPPRPVASLQ